MTRCLCYFLLIKAYALTLPAVTGNSNQSLIAPNLVVMALLFWLLNFLIDFIVNKLRHNQWPNPLLKLLPSTFTFTVEIFLSTVGGCADNCFGDHSKMLKKRVDHT